MAVYTEFSYSSLPSTTVNLIYANRNTIEEIDLMSANVDTSLLNNISLKKVTKLSLRYTRGDASKLLKACPNVQHLVIEGHIYIKGNLILEGVKILDLHLYGRGAVDTAFYPKKCPYVEQLIIRNSTIDFDNEDFSLSCLTHLRFENVTLTTRAEKILRKKLPPKIKLEECSYQKC